MLARSAAERSKRPRRCARRSSAAGAHAARRARAARSGRCRSRRRLRSPSSCGRRVHSGTLGPALPRRPRADRPRPGRHGQGDAHQDVLRLADRAPCHRSPPPSTGRFYEAWLKNDAGVLVPIGTFNEGRNVTLWAGVSPEDFTTLTVTREHADGDQASSGEKVLVGTADPGAERVRPSPPRAGARPAGARGRGGS